MSAKRKAPSKLAAPSIRPNARIPTKLSIDEKNTSVAESDALALSKTIEISSDSESEEDVSDDEEDAEDEEMQDAAPESDEEQPEAEVSEEPTRKRTNGGGKRPANDGEDDESDSEADAAPTFGDLLREQQTIDVHAALAGQASGASGALATQSTTRTITVPSASSLGTVLNQALRTDDTELLESCFATTDLAVVHNTIERLDSGLAANLLMQLGSRLHQRPGRAGTLMHWVQWTLVVHGARGLNSLLVLKGKLDLLDAQLKLRKKMQARQARNPSGDDDDEDDENVIYVEGEDDIDGDEAGARRKRTVVEDDDEVDELLLANGIGGDSDDEEIDLDGDDSDVSDGDESLDEDEVNYDDVDDSMAEDDDSDVEAAPPAKRANKSR
ncbi:unnamed protein product [Parascedosporium putredinis]|uniref:Small-subunit processome Utp12 domain-containing protein n=1 Tax=Parascedosporium putredinis TaxID=1442378 RepID=A0A9P1MA54_9PEZI|nr:unnamed protein product [Parascedosporium putredinis]CAI7992134.1 unnamed protein product [Parascedosporium putredinis]